MRPGFIREDFQNDEEAEAEHNQKVFRQARSRVREAALSLHMNALYLPNELFDCCDGYLTVLFRAVGSFEIGLKRERAGQVLDDPEKDPWQGPPKKVEEAGEVLLQIKESFRALLDASTAPNQNAP